MLLCLFHCLYAFVNGFPPHPHPYPYRSDHLFFFFLLVSLIPENEDLFSGEDLFLVGGGGGGGGLVSSNF